MAHNRKHATTRKCTPQGFRAPLSTAKPSQNLLTALEPDNRERSLVGEVLVLPPVPSILDPETVSDLGHDTINQGNLQLGKLCSVCQSALNLIMAGRAGPTLYYKDFNAIVAAVQNGCILCTSFFDDERIKKWKLTSAVS